LSASTKPTVEIIPLDQITVINPRERNERKFQSIVANVRAVGLKRPITVRRANVDTEPPAYDLVCGQGRLQAFQRLGQSRIPAFVITAERHDALIMSLVENGARRQRSAIEHINGLKLLSERGYSIPDIAKKVGLDPSYIREMLDLMNDREDRLVLAVERRIIPIRIAHEIAKSDSASTIKILTDAFRRMELSRRKLNAAKRVLQQRHQRGKRIVSGSTSSKKPNPKRRALVRAYRQEVTRQRVTVTTADQVSRRLRTINSAFCTLLQDGNFINLLRAEKMNAVPRHLVDDTKLVGTG